jgi:hypothetical protein
MGKDHRARFGVIECGEIARGEDQIPDLSVTVRYLTPKVSLHITGFLLKKTQV